MSTTDTLPVPGDRVIMVTDMPEDPDPVKTGEAGTVISVHENVGQIHVRWDSGRTLILLTTDPYRIERSTP